MDKKKNTRVGIIKYTLFVPLFAALLFVNNLQAQDNATKETNNATQGSQAGVKKLSVQGVEIPRNAVIMLNGRIVPREELDKVSPEKFASVSVHNSFYFAEFGGKDIYIIQTRY